MNKKSKTPHFVVLFIAIIIISFCIKTPDCYIPQYEVKPENIIQGDIVNTKQTLESYGQTPTYATGLSMYPTIKPGEICTCEASNTYKINDIVAYYSTEYANQLLIISHRVIDILPQGYVTQGDNNQVTDPFLVQQDHILCKIKEISLFEKIYGGK